MRFVLTLALALVTACPRSSKPAPTPVPDPPAPPPGPVTVSLVGTSDLHGHIEMLPVLAGYLDNLRAARKRDGGGVLLIDAGDMFQGTLESNSVEGSPVVEAYNQLGYQAAAIGNHEFDFGPIGPADTARAGGDPRGALRARAREAKFPFLMSNVLDAGTGKLPAWDNVVPSTLVEVAGVEVGVVGVTTMSTTHTTLTANVRDLEMKPIADAITAEAARLRERGAALVVVAAHAGAACKDFSDPDDLSSCEGGDPEIFEVARHLAPGTVAAIVGGHTHQAVAHRVNGIPIVQSYAYGRAFGRVDLTVDRGEVTAARVFPPQYVCTSKDPPCETHEYEGGDVTPSAALETLLAPAFARVEALKKQSLGVTLSGVVKASYSEESALGNLFTDLMLAARPDADVAITNGGGLRADLPAGPLTYGDLYEAMPFDNRFAFVRLNAGQLAGMFAANLHRTSGILSISGLTVNARCAKHELAITFERHGKPVPADQELTMLTNTFLASGGDGLFARLGIEPSDITEDEGQTMRDEMAQVLRSRGSTIDPSSLFDDHRRRVRYPGKRPVTCP